MEMRTEKRALDKIYKRRDRYDIPEWQRDEVWSTERKQLLLDSILRGWKIPKFYFAKVSDAPDEFVVVDGQQRLMAILEFYEGDLQLGATSAQEFGASSYSELPDEISDAFDDYEITYDEIFDSTEGEQKEFFTRLQAGVVLNASEQLHAVHSKLTNFARKLSSHDFFKQKVWSSDYRKAYFDIAAKVSAIEVDGITTGLRYRDLKRTFEDNSNFSPSSERGKRLTKTFDMLDRVFPEKDKLLRNRSTIQSFATLAAKIVAQGHERGCEKQLYGFFQHFGKELSRQIELGQEATDVNYVDFQRTLSANVKTGAKTRHEILVRKLLIFDPSFAEILGPDAVVESGITAEIERLAASICLLVAKVNEHYSATNGKDLVKATARTTAALTSLGRTVTDLASYEDCIDDLYFLFHEGVGQRLGSDVPQPFIDINVLRTDRRHDVDHGKNVSQKKKKLGQTFKKYGGLSSPENVEPEIFPMIQANLFTAVEASLRELLLKDSW
jgi:hypothetical protein